MNEFEHRFPQLFFGIYLGAFEEVAHLRQFGFWLLNRGAYVDVEATRPNANGILLCVDVAGKAAGLMMPYADTDAPLVLWMWWLLCEIGATARHVIYDGQWRGSDRSPLGHSGPLPSMVASVFSIDLNGYVGFGPA
jgi:hypothetical protein